MLVIYFLRDKDKIIWHKLIFGLVFWEGNSFSIFLQLLRKSAVLSYLLQFSINNCFKLQKWISNCFKLQKWVSNCFKLQKWVSNCCKLHQMVWIEKPIKSSFGEVETPGGWFCTIFSGPEVIVAARNFIIVASFGHFLIVALQKRLQRRSKKFIHGLWFTINFKAKILKWSKVNNPDF